MRKVYLVGLGLAAMVMLGTVVIGLQDSQKAPARPKLLLAESGQIMSALVHVAQSEGLFKKQGLDIEIVRVANGRTAMDRLVAAEVDLALSSDFPTARAILEKQPISVLATVQTSDRDIVIASPAGSGLLTANDLIGKRVGYVPNANSQHFLDLLLRQTGIADRVERLPFDSDELMAAMAAGKVDAISAWTTIRIRGASLFPKGLDVIAMPGLYTGSWVLSARRELVTNHGDSATRLLKALLEAEKVIQHRRDHVIPVVASATGIGPDDVAKQWEIYGFTLRLDQALLLSLDGQIRFAGGNPGPEMLDYLATDILRAADPSRVTILQ